MNCDKIQQKLSAYIDRELSDKENKAIENHIANCILCQKELEELKSVHRLVGQFKPVIQYPYPSEDFLLQVRRKIRNRYTNLSKPKIFPRLVPIFSAMATVLIIVIGIMMYRSSDNKIKSGQKFFSALNTEQTSATFIYNNLDTEMQDLVTEQVLNDSIFTDLQTLDLTIVSDMETDDLITMLTDNEKELLVQELLDKYEKTQ